MNLHPGGCCFFPWMYLCYSWHCLVSLARFTGFHSHSNFTIYIWPPHIRTSKVFHSNKTGWFSWSSVKSFSLNWKGVTTLFPHIKQKLSTANSFLQKKYGFSCLISLEGHPRKTKSITFEIIGSLFEISPISLDVTGAWISFVTNT